MPSKTHMGCAFLKVSDRALCRFESRWATVEIREDSPAVMLAGMGGSNLGIWCAPHTVKIG